MNNKPPSGSCSAVYRLFSVYDVQVYVFELKQLLQIDVEYLWFIITM